MTTVKHDRFQVGDIAYLNAGTREAENKCGEVTDIIPSGGPDKPHITIRTINDNEIHYDYDDVISLGRMRYAQGLAMIKVISDPDRLRESGGRISTPWNENAHRQWPILGVAGVTDATSDRRWALVEDPYTKQGHWMQKSQPIWFHINDMDQIAIQLEGIPPDL